MEKKRYLVAFLGALAALILTGCSNEIFCNSSREMMHESESFLPGAKWYDTEGNIIQAHGGQIQRMPVPAGDGSVEEKYVWVGEDKRNGHTGNCVAMYYSEDLYTWSFGGDVLRSVESREQLDRDPYFTEVYKGCSKEELDRVYDVLGSSKVIERPKMLYNEMTGKYVIWFHSDDSTEKNTYRYDTGMAGVAIADSPLGPFRLIDRYRLNHCPDGAIDCFPSSKGEARDMNLFKDDEGTAYIIYTSENNKTIYISRLNEEYTYLSKLPEEAVYGEDYIRIFPGAMREAPVLFKNGGRYYIMTSSTTGWDSNEARVWSADSIFGKWKNDGSPCEGTARSITYDTQSTSVFQAENGQWIYYGDRWNRDELADSRYIWLPVRFEEGKMIIRWQNEWSY